MLGIFDSYMSIVIFCCQLNENKTANEGSETQYFTYEGAILLYYCKLLWIVSISQYTGRKHLDNQLQNSVDPESETQPVKGMIFCFQIEALMAFFTPTLQNIFLKAMCVTLLRKKILPVLVFRTCNNAYKNILL